MGQISRTILVAGIAAAAGTLGAGQARIDPAKLIDLTYDFDAATVYWPTASPFHWEKENWGVTPAGYWYAAGRYSASEHGGTHIDSPIHFGKGQATLDKIPLERLVGAAAVVDIQTACARSRDYLLAAADIAGWEKAHGRIAPGTIVLVLTGWGRFWPDKKKYLGTDTRGDTANLHFPGISPEAAKVLAARKVAGVGIDTASIDHGPSKGFLTHRVLNGAGIYALENIARLDRVPATGATLIALPMKIKGGSGGPVRIVALLP